MSLSWKPPPAEHHNGQLIGYTVEITDVNGIPQQDSEQSDSNFVKIDGLNSDTEYKFHVSARTAAGSGPAATISGHTAEGGKGGLWYGVLLHETLLSFNNYRILYINFRQYLGIYELSRKTRSSVASL